jgi:hypothetical protein
VPDAEYTRRREPELARIAAARAVETGSEGWRQSFIWPVTGASRAGSARSGSTAASRAATIRASTSPAARDHYVAPADGVVVLAAAEPFTLEGYLLIIDHGMGLSSAFLHSSELLVREGDTVRQGQPIGKIGMTGAPPGRICTGAWCGAECRLDPLLFQPDRWAERLTTDAALARPAAECGSCSFLLAWRWAWRRHLGALAAPAADHAAGPVVPSCDRKSDLGPLELVGAWSCAAQTAISAAIRRWPRLATARCWRRATAAACCGSHARAPVAASASADFAERRRPRQARLDIESLTRDPASGRIWAAFESTTGSSATTPRSAARRRPARGDARLAEQQGPEAMVRLADGRFVVLAEGSPRWFDSGCRACCSRPIRWPAPRRSVPLRPARGLPPGRHGAAARRQVLILLREVVWGCRRAFAAS